MRVTVNPDQKASGDFGYAEAGEYTLRVVTCLEKSKAGGEFPYLEWKFQFADPNIQSVEKNSDGSSKMLGNVFVITTLKPDAQFALRDVCEALGLTWGDFDTDAVTGLEGIARVKLESYNNKIKNSVDSWKKK